MLELIKRLSDMPAVSGSEDNVRDYIISEISSYCDAKVDAAGNIIAFKKGKEKASVKLMIDAHMDEVGLMITNITKEGYLKFSAAGGIDAKVLCGRRVKIGNLYGIIGVKPIHLSDDNDRKKVCKADELYVDIGALNKENAEQYVKIGDTAVFDSACFDFGDEKIAGKALDDRVGCAILIEMIKKDQPFDMYFTFTVQEELGLRGAKTAAFAVDPQAAIVVETTTAADIVGVSEDNQVCVLGEGPTVSFMDKSTVYDREFYKAAFDTAKELNIKCQPKAAVAGGNNSGAIHTSKSGVRTVSVSVPCRYLHAPCGVVSKSDVTAIALLITKLAEKIAGGQV